MTAQQKIEWVMQEIQIQLHCYEFYGPQTTRNAHLINAPKSFGPSHGGYGDPYDRYGRGNKWGKQKSFNDHRGAL